MWVPDSAEQIANFAENNNLNETATFDAKAPDALDSTKEMAKDIAAMSTEGGVILYGVREDEHGNPTVLQPFELKDTKERISNAVQTCIQPPPQIEVIPFPLDDNPSEGFVAVRVPPSPEAPHMVTKNNDSRYYGRNGPSNVRLQAGQVERLFERRERLKKDRQSLLNDFEEKATIEPEDERSEFGYLRIVIQPLINRRGLLHSVLNPEDKRETETNVRKLIKETEGNVTLPGIPSNSFNKTGKWRREAEGYVGMLGRLGKNAEDEPIHRGRNDIWIGYDGGVYFNAGGIAGKGKRGPVFYEVMTAARTAKTINLAGRIYRETGYTGPADIALQITGIEGAASTFLDDPFRREEIGTDQITTDVCTETFEMIENPKEIAQSLLGRIFHVSTRGSAGEVFNAEKANSTRPRPATSQGPTTDQSPLSVARPSPPKAVASR